jgi:predicted DNA binding protein
MREVAFVVHYDEGTDGLMDVFREYPSLAAQSAACYASHDAMWRVDHITGPEAAMAAIDETFLDHDQCNECLDVPNCQTEREYHVLDRRPTARTVYTYRREVFKCHSIPYHVLQHVGDGVVFESRRSGDAYHWKVLYPGDAAVGSLFDDIEANLLPGLSLELRHLRESGNWSADTRTATELSPEQRATLEAAVEHGYYERPREVTVPDLADLLDEPRSTVQYRLRSAEDLLVRSFVGRAL